MAGPVDLTPVNDRIVTSRAPQSAVTPGQVAAPYRELAGELDKVGEVTDTLAVKAAEQAGENSVSRDADGNLQVQKPLIFGPASEVFARASRFAFLAQAEPEIDNKLAELRIQHPNDPIGFQTAAKSFGENYLAKNVPYGTLRGPVQKIIDTTSGQHYRALLGQADQTNVTNTQVALKSRIGDASNKLADLAFQGGTDTEEYKTLQGNVAAMYGELSSDPRMGYPKDRVDSELSQMASQHKVMAISGQAMRMLDSNSLTARADAKKFLINQIYGDAGLNLSMAQRHQAVTTAMGLMEARSSENKALIDANKAQVTTLLTNLHSTQPYNPITVNDAITNAAKIGDAESYYKLTFAKGMHDWSDSIRTLPMPQQVAALRALDTARITTGASSQAMEFFQSRGYSREQASGIVGNLIHESNLNPGAVGDNGTSIGIGQFHNERAAALKQFAAARGKSPNDFQTQLEFVDHELQTSEGATRAELMAARTPEEAARAFIGYERPQGYTVANPAGGLGYANRVANAQALAGGQTGAGRAWFEEARLEQVSRTRDYLKTQAGDYVDTTVKMLNKAGDVPDGILQNVSDVLRETGRDDLRQKIDTALMAHYGVQELDKLPQSVRQAWVTQSMFAGNGHLNEADAALHLNSEERALYQRHLTNLNGKGGVDNPDGSRSTLFQTTVEHDGKFYVIPTVFDGKILWQKDAADPAAAAIERVKQIGWDKFPSYKTEHEAEARYQQMHVFMERDTEDYQKGKRPPDSVLAYQVHQQMAAQIEANAKAMQETPYSTYAIRTNGKPPIAYNFDDPANVAAVAKSRAGTQAAITANDRTGPMSVFEGKEAEAFAGALTNGDSAAAAQSLAGLSDLPSDIYHATMAQKPIADAIAGMMGSKDPVRMSSAMQAVDKLWRNNPTDAENAFGKAALTKMQAWQGLQGSFNAAEIAERLNASDDPSTAKARETMRDAAENETKSMTPADMAYKLGSGFPIIGRFTGSTPAAPFDGIKGGELVADYRTTYSALRAYGVDADKASDLAVQRLQSTWGVSQAGGNQVMKNPPEKFYPAIGGSQAWIGQDLNAWIAGKVGPQTSGPRTLEVGIAGVDGAKNWNLEGLISDGQTAAEAASGRPPSYLVSIKKADGTSQIIGSRVTFDPNDHIAEHEADLERRRQAVDFLRTGQFQNAMPLP